MTASADTIVAKQTLLYMLLMGLTAAKVAGTAFVGTVTVFPNHAPPNACKSHLQF